MPAGLSKKWTKLPMKTKKWCIRKENFLAKNLPDRSLSKKKTLSHCCCTTNHCVNRLVITVLFLFLFFFFFDSSWSKDVKRISSGIKLWYLILLKLDSFLPIHYFSFGCCYVSLNLEFGGVFCYSVLFRLYTKWLSRCHKCLIFSTE